MSDAAPAPFGINETHRYTRLESEDLLYKPFTVGNHSTIELVDYMGGPGMVERVATAGHSRSIFPENPGQKDFMRYLVEHGVYEPFRAVQLKLSVRAPIVTALSFVYDPRANVNEYSGRYSVMSDNSWTPSPQTIGALLPEDSRWGSADYIHRLFSEGRQRTLQDYRSLLDTGLARELARSVLGTDNDTQFFWKMDLVSLADFVQRGRKRLGVVDHTRQCIEQVAHIAQSVGGVAWEALMSAKPTEPSYVSLTFPADPRVVDVPLSPSGWGPRPTRRVCVPELESILFTARAVLDRGEFQAVDYMGNDSAIAQAARTSYGQGTKKIQDDIGLINSLARDAHTTPLEMAQLAVESRAPLFSDPRQAGRHRTLGHHGFMGYFPKGDFFYLPSDAEFKYQDRVNRQGRGELMSEMDRSRARTVLKEDFKAQVVLSRRLRDLGAPEEIVRLGKGVGFYTRTWRTGDAHNWGKFLGLRMDPHAQYEVRVFAEQVDQALALQLPATHAALHTYMIDGLRLSTRDIAHISSCGLLTPGRNLDDLRLYAAEGLTVPVDKLDLSKGVKLSREGLALQGKLKRLLGQD